MSRPENPLAKYRSYSYQHVLMASASTVVFDQMSNPGFEFGAVFESRPKYDKHAPFEFEGGSSSIAIVIDTRNDANFSIDGLEIEQHLTAPGSQTSFMSVLKFKVVEPISAAMFLYTLNNIYSGLGTGPVDTVYCIKTFFYGYREDGGVDTITSVKPVSFFINTIDVEFNERGSYYDIMGVAVTNGQGHVEAISQINGMVSGIAVTKESTLGSVLNDLQNQLNAGYQKRALQPAVEQLQNSKMSPVGLKYEIILDEKFKDYIVDDFSAQISTNGSGDGASQSIRFYDNSDISDAIDTIMKKSKKLMSGAANDRTTIQSYAIVTDTVKESATSPMVIRYKIIPHIIYKSKEQIEQFDYEQEQQKKEREQNKTTQATNVESQSNVQSSAPDIEGLLYLDYLYTGKNIDILDFEMKISNANLMFSGALLTSNIEPKAGTVLTTTTGNTPTDISDSGTNPNKKALVTGPRLQNTQTSHSTSPALRTEFMKELSNQVSFQVQQATVTIFGNPDFLGALTASGGERLGGEKWSSSPYYVKIDTRSMDPNNNELYPFWYQGIYRIIAVIHSFDGGVFKQTLQLLTQPDAQDVARNVDSPRPAPQPAPQHAREAYVTTDGCWQTPPNGMQWEPLFQAATQENGLPCGMLSRVAYQESRYNPNASNSIGAMGMMQILMRAGHPDRRWWSGPLDPFDPNQAIPYAGRMLRYLHDAYGFTWEQTLAAYNWGEGNVKKIKNDPNWLSQTPSETYNYVVGVGKDTDLNPPKVTDKIS